jgi:hypothetical protein
MENTLEILTVSGGGDPCPLRFIPPGHFHLPILLREGEKFILQQRIREREIRASMHSAKESRGTSIKL